MLLLRTHNLENFCEAAFCILSACKLGRLGWKTTVGKHGVDMAHEKTGVRATDVSIWHDTPLVLVKPYLGNDVKLEPPALSAVLGDMISVLTPDEMAACFTGRQFFLLIMCYPLSVLLYEMYCGHAPDAKIFLK